MRSWKFSNSLSSVMFFRKESSVLIPGFDLSLSRDTNSTVSRLKWGTNSFTHEPLWDVTHTAWFTKSVDSNFRAFWLAPVNITQNILGYSLFWDEIQNGFSFRDSFEWDETLAVNEKAAPTNTKKQTKFGLSVFTVLKSSFLIFIQLIW